MKVVCDIEANSLTNPTQIWCIVCKDVATGLVSTFRKVTQDEQEKDRFLAYASKVTHWIGHNWLEYDYPVLNSLLALHVPDISVCSTDTLIISRLVDYSRKGGHSIEQYGEEFGLPKIDIGKSVAGHNPFFNQWSPEMEVYCARDVAICEAIYNKYLAVISDPAWSSAIRLEHRFQLIVNDLHNNGFAFDTNRATKLLEKVTKELGELDGRIREAFPPREVIVKEFTPRATKFGTISKTSVPRQYHTRIHEFEVGRTYPVLKTVEFNPSSHKQLIEVLNEAGWKPEDKTQTHIDTERENNALGRNRVHVDRDLSGALSAKLSKLKSSGWKINENNLSTLPENAPAPARLLAKRILLESRRRTLVEWLSLVRDDGRIHGKFVGLGAWTHRMAHQKPNTANIPREFKEDGTPKLLGKEMRSLWCAPKNRLLVGVDAEGIQLRIFAHYIDDQEFTDALVNGKKSDRTDPHSLNQRILGDVCKTRQAAKRFVYALLLGGGINKLAAILETSKHKTEGALERLLERYQGFAYLKKNVIPNDAKRGWFSGLDGRRVKIPGDTQRDREHLCMSGYLQNGESIIIKKAATIIRDECAGFHQTNRWKFIDIVHDELQSETSNSMNVALEIAKIKADAIKTAGEYYKLKCPMAGSYYNEDNKDYTIGTNWYATH